MWVIARGAARLPDDPSVGPIAATRVRRRRCHPARETAPHSVASPSVGHTPVEKAEPVRLLHRAGEALAAGALRLRAPRAASSGGATGQNFPGPGLPGFGGVAGAWRTRRRMA